MKYHTFIAIALVAVTSCCTGNACNPFSFHNDTIPAEPVIHKVTLLFGGDLMQHEPQIKSAARPGGKYDYTGVFDQMKAEIESADIAIANFEVTLGGPPYRGYPQFCAPDEYLQAIKDAGFDVLTTCNNHSVDTYARGIGRTITMMDSLHIPHLGTYRNEQEREAQYPFIIEHDSIRICLLNYTYGTNGIPVPKPCIVNALDTLIIAADIERAKSMHPDIIICMPHWGDEYHLLPNEGQKQLANWLFAHGVDHIIGGHPHVVEPIEVREEADGRHVLAYSLGNFVSNQSRPNTDGGTMVRLSFTKEDGKTTLTDCGYNLYWVSRPVNSGKRYYRVLPSNFPTDSLNANERSKMSTYLTNTRAHFAKYNIGITEYAPARAE